MNQREPEDNELVASNVTYVDERAPVEEVEPTFAERFPLGCVLAWNGPQADGQRKRGVVINHSDDETGLLVLDGPTTIELSPDDLKDAIVLAKSVDGYGQRVTAKAKALGKEYRWCEVANDAVHDLNNSPEDDPHDQRKALKVVITTVGQYVVMPTRDAMRVLKEDADRYRGDHVALMRRNGLLYTQAHEFNSSYYRHQTSESGHNPLKSITVTVVDEFPGDDAEAATDAA